MRYRAGRRSRFGLHEGGVFLLGHQVGQHVRAADFHPEEPRRTGRIGRSGRAVTFVEPKQAKELAAIEDHIGTKLTPWKPGEKAAPAKVEEKPKRHAKPQITRSSDEPSKRCVAAIGSADGVEVADLIGAITGATGLEGEAIRDVRVLDRVSLFSLPESELDQALASLKDAKVGGQALSAEPLR